MRSLPEGKADNMNFYKTEKYDKDWLGTDNPYAAEDRKMLRADGGRYMNLIGIIGKRSE